MASLTCFCSTSGMILMVKASDRSLVMENADLMALKASRTWKKTDDGDSIVVTGCHWENKRLLWADSRDVTWLLVGSVTETSLGHLDNVLGLISETYNVTTLVTSPATAVEPSTTRDMKYQLKNNTKLNEIVDFLILGVSSLTKELFADATGCVDSEFLGMDVSDLTGALTQFGDEAGLGLCVLLRGYKLIAGDNGWCTLPLRTKCVVTLLAQHTQGQIEVYWDRATKYLVTFHCSPSVKLVGIASLDNESKLLEHCWVKFCRKYHKTLRTLEDAGDQSSELFFVKQIQAFLIIHQNAGECWSCVRPPWCKADDDLLVFRRIQGLRQIFGQMSNFDPENEYYEINRTFASYGVTKNGYKVIALFQPEVSTSTLFTIGQNLVSLGIRKLEAAKP